MKKYVFYPGCVMQTEQYAYEISIRAILPKLDVQLVDIEGFSLVDYSFKDEGTKQVYTAGKVYQVPERIVDELERREKFSERDFIKSYMDLLGKLETRRDLDSLFNEYGGVVLIFKPSFYKKVAWGLKAPGGKESLFTAREKGKVTHDIVTPLDVDIRDFLVGVFPP